jgi:hypothetical protein
MQLLLLLTAKISLPSCRWNHHNVFFCSGVARVKVVVWFVHGGLTFFFPSLVSPFPLKFLLAIQKLRVFLIAIYILIFVLIFFNF